MYRLDWIEQLKLRRTALPRRSGIGEISPVVWGLGATSLLTDVSSEMVNSILPVYLVLHLHLSPLQYGAIDGVYNGLSIALVGLTAGVLADRWSRRKEIAGAGYALSAACKLLLLTAGGAWGWIMAIVGLDRLGKGIRTAPRDALISLYTPASLYGTAFGVHRALDSMGALLGPIVAFALLAQVPGDFAVLWTVSFLIALLGVAALWLFVPRFEGQSHVPVDAARTRAPAPALTSPRFMALTAGGAMLALVTVSDGFIYLLLQQKGQGGFGLIPLFYVVTAAGYMLFAIPVGLAADRFGRARIFFGGYGLLALLYGVLLVVSDLSLPLQLACLVLLGLYYAATEGVLMALASTIVPAERRATGLAVLTSCIGVGKLISSVVFGWIWQRQGPATAILVFAAGTMAALALAGVWLRARRRE